jgi:hypothetical protein
MKLNPVCEEKTSKERVRGKGKPLKEKCKEDYPEARGWTGNDFRAGGKSLCQIILQDADLLGALQVLLLDLGLDLVPNGGRVGVRGFCLLHGGASGGTGRGRASLAHDGGAQLGISQEWEEGKMQCRSGAQGRR